MSGCFKVGTAEAVLPSSFSNRPKKNLALVHLLPIPPNSFKKNGQKEVTSNIFKHAFVSNQSQSQNRSSSALFPKNSKVAFQGVLNIGSLRGDRADQDTIPTEQEKRKTER